MSPYQNFLATRLFTDAGAADTTLTLELAPTATSGRLVLEARNPTKREIISYTGVSGNDITGVTRGQGGTDATTHIKGSLVEMNVTAEDLDDALGVPEDIVTRADETIGDFVASGMIWTDDTGLAADMSAGVAYINGLRLPVDAVSNHDFTASKDTYVDYGDNGVLDYNEVANGAAAPALAASHLRLARVVSGAADITSVTNYLNASVLVADNGWRQGILPTVSSVAYNGNRSYDVTFASTVASYLTPGMRLRLNRTVTAPIQCTDLEAGSAQYYSKTTPTGVTFTDDHTEMGWVKLESYAAGGIIARRNADTEGWSLSVNASGQVVAGSYRIASNNSVTTSYQSLPLNKWVHVAATTDLSGTSVLIYIDGVAVPRTTVITGTITALVQGTTALVVGAEKSAGTNPLDGKLAQAAVFSAVLTAATIRSYASQGLSGSETSIVSAYSFDNLITDLNTTNANNLSAQGSAVATAADSPFALDANGTASGTYEWGIVTKVVTTVATVQVPEGSAIPTSGGVSAVSYSTQKAPYGFPADISRWILLLLSKINQPITATSYATTLQNLTIPVGSWLVSTKHSLATNNTASATRTLSVTLSTDTTTETDPEFTVVRRDNAALDMNLIQTSGIINITVASATLYTLLAKISSATSYTASLQSDSGGNGYIKAQFGLL